MKTMAQFQKKIKCNQKLNRDSLIICPACQAAMGIKKWLRLEGLTCPACGRTFKDGQRFDVYQITRVPSSRKASGGREKQSLDVSAIATVEVKDILTKGKVVQDPVKK